MNKKKGTKVEDNELGKFRWGNKKMVKLKISSPYSFTQYSAMKAINVFI